MAFKTTLAAASIKLLGTADLLGMPAPSEAKDGCGRPDRFSNSQQRFVRRTDVVPRLVQPTLVRPAVVRPFIGLFSGC